MSFENATPRPWVIRTSRDTSGDVGITADGLPNVLAETFADIRFRGERNAAEARANAELIVTAVNAHEATMAALSRAEARIASAIRDGLHLEGFTAQQMSDLVDNEPTIIAIREALKLARAEK